MKIACLRFDAYIAPGGTDKVAKGPELGNKLATELAAMYPKALTAASEA